ncbi:hypothetical protein B7463_g464, partial [Scytalidium lignicola]
MVHRQQRHFTVSREYLANGSPKSYKAPARDRKNVAPFDTKSSLPKKTNEDPEDPDEPHTKTGQFVIGGIILACCTVTSWYLTTTNTHDMGERNAPRKKDQFFEDNFILSRRNIQEGRWWTIVTSSFAHTSIPHLMVNMFCLWSAGPLLYGVLGPAKFAVLYLGSSITGSALQLSWWAHEKRPTWIGAVGASGSLTGIFTFAAGLWPNMRMSLLFFIPMRLWQGIAAFTGFSVTALAEGWFPSIGHADHLGGMAFGAAYAGYLLFRMRKGKQTPRYLMRK